MTTREIMVRISNVSKRYAEGERAVWALRDIEMTVGRAEFVSVIGPSGSGKSTLLNLIGGLDHPTTGEVVVGGNSVTSMSPSQLARLRRETVVFIFQFFNLLPSLTAEQNVSVPLRAAGVDRRSARERVDRALASVGLADRAQHYPEELSGGELQRVAIARALATDAALILADEPTGNLDSVRGEEILELLKRAVEKDGRSVVLVTHDNRAAAYGDRIVVLRDGRIADEIDAVTGSAEMLSLDRDVQRK